MFIRSNGNEIISFNLTMMSVSYDIVSFNFFRRISKCKKDNAKLDEPSGDTWLL